MMRQMNAALEAAQRYWTGRATAETVAVLLPEAGMAVRVCCRDGVACGELLWQQEPCVLTGVPRGRMESLSWTLRRYICSGRHALRNLPLPGTPYADCAAALEAFDQGAGAQLSVLAQKAARLGGDVAAVLLTGPLAGFYPAEHAVRQACCFAPMAPGGLVELMPEVCAAGRTVGCQVQLQLAEVDERFCPVKALLPLADADTPLTELPRESPELLALPGGRVQLLVDGRECALPLPDALPDAGVVCRVRLELDGSGLWARVIWPGMDAPVGCALVSP